MQRAVIVVDRLAAFVLGAALTVAGAAALGWRLEFLPDAPQRLRARWLPDAVEASWWPWATGAAGVILVVLGLVWLSSHLRRRGVARLQLAGSSQAGRLTTDARAAADAAAQALTQTDGVRRCTGRVVLDRGQLVAELRPAIEPSADLDTIRAAAEQVSHELFRSLGRDDLHHRVQVHVARHDHPTTPQLN